MMLQVANFFLEHQLAELNLAADGYQLILGMLVCLQ
jgi:hypothetical protein